MKPFLKIISIFTVLILLVCLYFTCFFQRHYGPLTDHFDGSHFHNLEPVNLPALPDILKWKWTSKATPWPALVQPSQPEVISDRIQGNVLKVTFVNHATFLIQTHGFNILTDPVWSEKVGPLNKVGPHRVVLPGIPFEKLPKIDMVFISHDHYDHLDRDTLERLIKRDNPIIYGGLGIEKIINDIQPDPGKIKTMDWWDTISYGNNLTLTFVPAQHWSGRWILDKNTSLWGGFVISAGLKKIYFAGDTGYSPHFATIFEKMGPVDIALLPIGAYKPRWFMKNMHMSPWDAVKAHQDLQARISIPMHYGTFNLADEGYFDPLKDLYIALTEQKIPGQQFPILTMGSAYILT